MKINAKLWDWQHKISNFWFYVDIIIDTSSSLKGITVKLNHWGDNIIQTLVILVSVSVRKDNIGFYLKQNYFFITKNGDENCAEILVFRGNIFKFSKISFRKEILWILTGQNSSLEETLKMMAPIGSNLVNYSHFWSLSICTVISLVYF